MGKVQELNNFYTDSDIALYTYARNHNCINEAYEYMCEGERTVGQVIEYIYDRTGRPNPQLVIIDDETGEDCTEECIKKYREISAAHSRNNIQEYTKQDMKDYYSMAN